MKSSIDRRDEQPPVRASTPPAGKFSICALVLFLLVVFLLGSGTVAITWVAAPNHNRTPAGEQQGSTQEPKVGSAAPDFVLADVNTGQSFTLSSLRGRPVWINFWATWCPPCKTELPLMKLRYNKYKDQGLAIVGIDMQEDPALVKTYTESNGFDWTFVVDQNGAVTNRYFTSGIPQHFFVDASGVIQAIYIGDLQEEMMEELLGKIVDTPSSQETR